MACVVKILLLDNIWLSLLTHQITQLQMELILQGIQVGFPLCAEKSCCSRAFPLLGFPKLCQRARSIQTLLFSFSEATSGLQLSFWCSQVPSCVCHPLSLSCSPFPWGKLRWSSPCLELGRNHPRSQLKRDLIWNNLQGSQEKPIFEWIFLMPIQCLVNAPLKILIQVKCAGTESEKDFFPWNTRKASFLCTESLFWASALLWCVWSTATSHCILSALWNCLYFLGYIYQEKKIYFCGRENTHISRAIPSPPPHQTDLWISLFQELLLLHLVSLFYSLIYSWLCSALSWLLLIKQHWWKSGKMGLGW